MLNKIAAWLLKAVNSIKDSFNKEKAHTEKTAMGTIIRWGSIAVGLAVAIVFFMWLFVDSPSPSNNTTVTNAPSATSAMANDRYDYGDTIEFNFKNVFWGIGIFSLASLTVSIIVFLTYRKKLYDFKQSVKGKTDEDALKDQSVVTEAKKIEENMNSINKIIDRSFSVGKNSAIAFVTILMVVTVLWSFFPKPLYEHRALTEKQRLLGEKTQSALKMPLYKITSGLVEITVKMVKNPSKTYSVTMEETLIIPDIEEVYYLGVKGIKIDDYAVDPSDSTGKWFYVLPSKIMKYEDYGGIKDVAMTGETPKNGWSEPTVADVLSDGTKYTMPWWDECPVKIPTANGDSIRVGPGQKVIVAIQDLSWRFFGNDTTYDVVTFLMGEKQWEMGFVPNPVKNGYKWVGIWEPDGDQTLKLQVKIPSTRSTDALNLWTESPRGQNIAIFVLDKDKMAVN